MKMIEGTTLPEIAQAATLSGHIGSTVLLQGHIHKLRKMAGFAFVLLRTRRDVIQCVWSPETASFPIESLCEEMPVRLTGQVIAEPRSRTGWEVHLTACEILSTPAGEPPAVLNGKSLQLSLDTLLDLRPATLRNPQQRAIFKLQEGIAAGIRSFLESEQFTEIHSPKLVATGAEGGANVFALDYFGKPAYLTQSPQFYKQIMVGVFERVFEIAPVFRAEKHDTARHLNEYTSVDLEMGFIHSFEDIMQLETRMLRHVMQTLGEAYAPEIALLSVQLPEITTIPAIPFEEAKALVSRTYNRAITDEKDLEPEEERLLCEWITRETGSEFVFVTHYPSAKRPFYTMDSPGNEHFTESFDLLFRGVEVTTGGQRIHDYAMQVDKINRLALAPEQFESFLIAHRTGLPPHGGLGLGLERFTARLLNLSNVRQATIFPRDKRRLEP